MTIAVLISVHDGMVLAADSASSLAVSASPGVVLPPGQLAIANVYDHANKIFNLVKGLPIGCVTYGSGNIGSASIGTLIKDLRKKLTDSAEELEFDRSKYEMEHVANIFAKFFKAECDRQDAATRSGINTGFLLGGYSTPDAPLSESWSVEIVNGIPQSPKKLREPTESGINWGGQGEILQRIMLGFSPSLFDVLAEVTQPAQNPHAMAEQLAPLLTARLQAQMLFAPMPIQDAIDLARFLVHSAIMFSRFSPGPNVVGGPIEIAAITKHEKFKWISRKHYYEQSLNKEPINVICDRRAES